MPKFQFRLQQYLGVKEQIEDQKELEYAKALQKVEEEKAQLEKLNNQREIQLQELRMALTKPILPTEINRYNNIIERLKSQIKMQEKRLEEAKLLAEEKRQELIQAMKERKALETVKENAREEFIKEADIIERKQVDELVSFKYTDKLSSR
jgi:flagellar FliJ protein